MNEDAIKDAYDLFVNTGYNKSYDNFKALIQSNPNARKDAYDLFVSTGYNKTQKDFDQLMGIGAPAPVKKKEQVSPSQQKAQPTSLATGGEMAGGPSEPSVKKGPSLQEQLQASVNLAAGALVASSKPGFTPVPKEQADKALYGKSNVQPGTLKGVPGDTKSTVQNLNEKYKDLGVNFKEAPSKTQKAFGLGDIVVTADDGSTHIVQSTGSDEKLRQEEAKLQTFLMGKSAGVEKKPVSPLEFLMMSRDGISPQEEAKFKRVYSQELVDSSIKFANNELEKTKNGVDKIQAEIAKLNEDAMIGGVTPEIEARFSELQGEYERSIKYAKSIASLTDEGVKKAAGENARIMGEQGNLPSAMYNSLLKFVENSATGALDIANQAATVAYSGLAELASINMGVDVTAEDLGSSKAAREMYTKAIDDVMSSVEADVSEEYVQSLPTVLKALVGAAEFVPNMLIPAANIRYGVLVSQGVGRRLTELNDSPMTKDLPENEKFFMSAVPAMVEAALENFGISQWAGANKGLISSVTVDVLSKVVPQAGMRGVKKLINAEINNLVLRGAVNTAGAMISEAETGALQSISDTAFREAYEIAKGKDLFKQPGFNEEGFKEALLEDAKMEALGGMWMAGAANIAQQTAEYVTGKSNTNETFALMKQILASNTTESALASTLKSQILSGKISKEKAKNTLYNFREAKAIVRDIPQDLSEDNQRAAFDLIAEKRKLTKQIEGKDPALVDKQKKRITEIDNQLITISNAVQEQATSEVPVQPEARTGEEVVEGKPQPEPQVVAEEGQEKVVIPAGKRLFNEPNPETVEISKTYKEKNNIAEPEGVKIEAVDVDNASKIADAYEALQDTPNDPEVQDAYNAMADETAKQHQDIVDAGYEVEIWQGEGEPYANAQEMIDDVKNNKHMFIYSTEQGFGDAPITEEQRKQNKLLQDSGFKDKTGKTLLYNDLFRFVHDFFGHTERGNGFGPVGEENAWDVHARMYTPKARRAMTTETRGQNSWVNFGPQMRNEDGSLKKKGDAGYLSPKDRQFAPQKMALMPEEFSQIVEATSNFEEAVNKSAQSLNMVAPGLKIIIAENTDDAQMQIAEALSAVAPSQAGEVAGGFTTETRGQTVFVNGKPYAMVFNKETADSVTAGHEVWETLLNDAFADDQARMKEFVNSIDAQLRAQGFEDIADRLEAFASQRGYEAVKYSEYMAELGGMLVASGFGKGPLTAQQKTLLQKIGDIINKFAQLFTGKKQFLDQATPEDILGFMITISEKVSKGEDVASFFRKGDKAKAKEGVTSRKQANEAFDGAMKDLGIDVGTINEKTGKSKVTNYDIATALNKYYEKIHKKFDITDFSDNVVNVVSDYAKNEILFALSRFGKNSGKGWYTEDYAKALNTLSKLDKDIAKKPAIKEVATAIIAVASNSTDVYTNLTRVLYGIDKFKSTQKVPTDVGTGKGASAIASGVERYNNILSKFDNDPVKVAKFLQQIDSISNLKKKLVDTFGVKSYAQAMADNLATDPEWNDSEVLPMSILIFGPKIGAFYSNLSGLDGTPTIDRWCIRTVYRYRGDMRSKVSEKEMQDFKDANDINGVSYSDALVLAQEHSKLFNAILTGRGQYKGMPKDERNAALKPYRKGDQIWKKAQGVVNDISEGIEYGVSNKKQYAKDFRSFTKKAFESARDKVMEETGEKLSVSDVQAILWIYEKNLFGHLGVKQREDSTYSAASKTLSDKVESGTISLDKLKSGDLSILEQADIETDGAMGDIYGSNVGEFKEGIDDAKKRNTTVTSRSQKSVPAVVDEVLTDDGKGNYVFVHYSDEKRDTIKPMSGSKKNFTGREEVAAISSVGGVAMYYTKQGQKEQGVGNVPHTVLVPKDKVYFYGTTERGKVSNDPENFEPEARRRFQEYKNRGNETRPTTYAFDSNNAAAWVTKVAAENGYDMVVTNWGAPKSYRAQTVKELTPEAEYTGFKQLPDDVFEVGDEVFVYGNYGNIVKVDGKVLTISQENQFGTFNERKFEVTPFTADRILLVEKAKPTVTTRAQKVDVTVIPGYERMMGEVEGIIEKTLNRGGSYNQASANAIGYIQKSAVYERADDSQREQIIRDFKKIRGEKMKAAPSVARIMGEIKDTKEVTVKEKTALKDQIKLEAKAAKDAVAYVKQLRTQISTALRAMTGRGVISARQATTILARYDKMNILNPVMRDRFVDYMSNVLQRAEYLDKIREASKLRKAIKKASKSADNQAEVSKMAKDFAGIDPSRVEDIDQYIENATQVLNSAARKTGDPLMRNPVNMANMANYIEQEMEIQNEQIKNEILSKYQELVDAGVLSSDMTINEIKRVVAAIEENDSDAQAKAAKAKEALKGMMEEISPVIMQMVRTGEDPFTGEPIELTYDEKKALKSLTEMDLDNLSLADAVKVVEYANNFVANGITSGIVGITELYNGSLEPGKLVKKGFKSIPIRKYFMKGAGKVWAEGFATLPMLNKLFWGDTRRAMAVSEASGVTGISNGKAKALRIVDKAAKEYIAKFAKAKDFLASENVLERGMVAFMSRGVIGDEFQAQDEFNRRKSLIEETIQALKDPENSTDLEIAKGEVAQKVYDKILKDSKNAEEVRSKASKTNVDAVDWWINEWSKYYDQMDEVSRNVYNTELSRDINYTPDRFQMKEAPTATEEDFESSFFGNFEYVDTSKSGSLKKNNRIKNLPEDKNGVKKRIVNLDFDINNVNALTNALVDVETAGSVMKVKGFVTSKDFSKLFSSKEDRDLYKKRIVKYVSRVKGGSYVDQNELAKMNKVINAIASFGVAKALFSLSQPLKQFVPPMLNTLTQTGRFDIAELFKGGMEFIDNSGYPIANRGIGSQGELKSINRKLVEAEKNLALRGLDGVAEFSNAALELTLKNPDIYAARASWISFYLSELKKQGIKPSSINWRTHKLNKQAADYAQSMVDSQQNISDTDMQGEILASKQPGTVFLRRALLPLMTFTLNQKTRIWADIRTIGNEVSSKEDKLEAKKSLAGALVELTAFSAISFGVKELLYMTAQAIFGVEEDDEEEEKKKRIMRQSASTAQNFLRDFFIPPLPGLDIVASGGVNILLDKTGMSEKIPQKWFEIEDEKVRFNLYDKQNQGYLEMLGTQGIAAEKALELAGYYDMAIDGKFTDEYKENKVEKQILEEDRKAAALNALVMSGYYGGLLPSDIAYVVGIINKKIQKRAETAEEED
jgi:hypothetical protein